MRRLLVITLVAVCVFASVYEARAQIRMKSGGVQTSSGRGLGQSVRAGLSVGQNVGGVTSGSQRAAAGGFWYTTMNEITVVSTEEGGGLSEEIPSTYELQGNYPNPFNPSTRIRYGLPEKALVRLQVYNVLGQMVTTLVDKEQPAGYYDIEWNARGSSGQSVPSGLYFYRIETASYSATRSMVFQK